MKVKLNYDSHDFLFTIQEEKVLYKIPFNVILNRGRKLIYYSYKSSRTPVYDWYEKLEENYKQEVEIQTISD